VFGVKIGRHSMVTDAQRVELWRRYKAGETVLSIAHRAAFTMDVYADYWLENFEGIASRVSDRLFADVEVLKRSGRQLGLSVNANSCFCGDSRTATVED
jgi:hypothetical protein